MRHFTMVFSACALLLGVAGLACNREELFVSSHVLELRADGSIRCDGEELSAAEGNDTEGMRRHLQEIAREMPHAPVDPKNPNGPKVPTGRLDVRIDGSGTCSALLRSTETLVETKIQIGNLRILVSKDDREVRRLAFRLPMDAGIIRCRTSIEDDPILVRYSGEASGSSGLGVTIAVLASESFDGEGPIARKHDERNAADLDAMKEILVQLHTQWPERIVEFEVPAGLPFARMLEAVDVASHVGFRRVAFAGGWIES